MLLVIFIEVAAVVGHEDDEQIVPLLRLLHVAEKSPDAIIHIGKAVVLPFLILADRHIPGFMAAQGGKAYQERLAVIMLPDQPAQGLEGNIIPDAPFRSRLFFLRVVLLPVQLLETRTDQVALHLGEVDVAAIKIVGSIALTLQAAGYARKAAHPTGHLHDRHRGERHVAAERTHRPPIRAVAVAVAVGEVDSLSSRLAKMGHHIQKHAAATLQQDDHHVRPAGRQEGVARNALTIIERPGQLLHLRLAVEVVESYIVNRILEGGKEGEHRIDGGMVQELVLRIIHLSDIGCRLIYASSDADDYQGNHQNGNDGGCNTMSSSRKNRSQSVVEPIDDGTADDHTDQPD